MCNLDAGLVARLSQLISCPQIVNLIIQPCNNANNKNRYESENINEKRGVKNGNATILAFEKKRRKSSVKKKKSPSTHQSSPCKIFFPLSIISCLCSILPTITCASPFTLSKNPTFFLPLLVKLPLSFKLPLALR